MSAASPHNKIIKSIARAKLSPLGIQQKGRSRVWHDDRHWYVITIEFQPSGFSKGSYLNVAVSWLWYPKDSLSFDLPHESRPWVDFRDEAQFRHDFEALVDKALEAIGDLRGSTGTLRSSYERVLEAHEEFSRPGGWPDVHLGLLAALTGQPERANGLWRYVIEEESGAGWIEQRKAFLEKAISLLVSVDDLRAWVESNITECRSRVGLPSLEAPLLPES